ncbi:LOW QUALITY PROTEIN: T-lymphocyte surface antigen Ly-9-like [Camarhynchus parvulus]|uniref:LOW QUALITY PROTEIN: T-lymphocyte surface antigen Ly-9-like n=1 Tax=Geospiza parvula TaxID=87175 RepID=UPI0012380CCB|nr:LOW QUALITY PROTEIN: T-lymphocyte surface antigen Ly-9-like [Camarhynchus parvulus]
MDVFWIPLLAILVLLHQTSDASDPKEVIGVLGGSMTLRAHDAEGNAAHWNFGGDPIVTVPFRDPRQAIFHKDTFETRFAVSEKGHVLRISQLRMEDAGTYSVIIGEKRSTFTLRVFKELAEPTVTCEAQNCSGGSCSSSLRCSAPGAGLGNVSYTWRIQGRTWDGSSVVLLLNETSQEEPEPLTCTARNPVSNRSVTVTAPGMSAQVPFSSSQVGLSGGFCILAGILVAALLLIFLVLLWKSKGWTEFRLSQSKPADTGATNDYTTVYAEVGPSQQRVPDGTKAKPAEGGPSSTIYSLVKRPDQVDGGTAQNATTTGLELV